jgi:hypothetical protein
MAQGTIPESAPRYWNQKWFPWLVFGGFAVIYLINRSPFVGFNDGLTFLDSAATGFDFATNATSHFLYNNLQHVLLKVFFFLPHVVVLTLFSISCALGTLFLGLPNRAIVDFQVQALPCCRLSCWASVSHSGNSRKSSRCMPSTTCFFLDSHSPPSKTFYPINAGTTCC